MKRHSIDRIKVIQFLIDKYDFDKYLEIGTQRGHSFLPIRCRKKVAVDPLFMIEFKYKIKWYLLNTNNFRNEYHEMTSEEFFFYKKKKKNDSRKFDIVFVDGLHTFLGTLHDILNSLKFLEKNGLIVIHDCFPPHKAAATVGENADEVISRQNSIPGWTGEWCGDTWKAIVYLRRKYPTELKIQVLNLDYGLGIVRLRSVQDLNFEIDEVLISQVGELNFEDLIAEPENLIGLLDKDQLKNI